MNLNIIGYMNLDILVFCVLLLGSIFIGSVNASSVKTESSYLLADRKTKLFPLIATLVMTEFNPSTLIGFSSVGYVAGVWGLTLPVVFLFGLLFYTFVVAKKWKRLNASSVAELFTLRYGSIFGKISSSFLLIALLGFSSNYLKSMQILFSPILSGLMGWEISIVLVILIIFITLRGGLISIIKTDVWSFLAILVFIPLLYYYSIPDEIISEVQISDGINNLPPKFIISLIILTMFTYISAPWYGQKIFSAENENVAFIAVGVSSIIVFALYSVPILAVYNLKISNINILNGEVGLTYIINNKFPIGFRGFGYLVIFLAGTTTLAGVWSSMTTMIVSDFLNEKESRSISQSRSIIITFIIIIFSFFVSEYFIDKILDKLILANIPIAALSYGLIGAFYFKKSTKIGVLVSILYGLFWGIFCYIYFGESGGYTWYWSVYGIPQIFLIGFLFSALFPKNNAENERFIEFQRRMEN
jgi:SSS family solute:Na+ symporter